MYIHDTKAYPMGINTYRNFHPLQLTSVNLYAVSIGYY